MKLFLAFFFKHKINISHHKKFMYMQTFLEI